jgi:ATP-binding cassette subfamily B protein
VGSKYLQIIAKHYGKTYSLKTLRDLCHIAREGVSMLGISDDAESIGLHSVGMKLTWTQFYKEVNLPCIIQWNQNHFVVVYNIKKRNGKKLVYVSDPAEGLLKYPEKK